MNFEEAIKYLGPSTAGKIWDCYQRILDNGIDIEHKTKKEIIEAIQVINNHFTNYIEVKKHDPKFKELELDLNDTRLFCNENNTNIVILESYGFGKYYSLFFKEK